MTDLPDNIVYAIGEKVDYGLFFDYRYRGASVYSINRKRQFGNGSIEIKLRGQGSDFVIFIYFENDVVTKILVNGEKKFVIIFWKPPYVPSDKEKLILVFVLVFVTICFSLYLKH